MAANETRGGARKHGLERLLPRVMVGVGIAMECLGVVLAAIAAGVARRSKL